MSQGAHLQWGSLHGSFEKGRWLTALGVVLVWGASLMGSCSPNRGPQTGSQTNWYRLCDEDTECGQLSCVCGTCTEICEDACSALPEATCFAESDTAAQAMCGGIAPRAPVCLGRCIDEESCPAGSFCDDGVCLPRSAIANHVTIDLTTRFETLDGFGCSIGYSEPEIASHPEVDALYDAMFAQSGLDVVRLRNTFGAGEQEDLSAPGEIIGAAIQRMDPPPIVVMTSGSPPPNLKENGSRTCGGNPETCTLVQTTEGDFDYPAFADHFRASLEAYAAVGVEPDYLSIQNNPNWLPSESEEAEACRFLPQEGTTTVSLDGAELEVRYPGYQEAVSEVEAALVGLDRPPALIGPAASGLLAGVDFMEGLATDNLVAAAIHLYGSDVTHPEIEPFEAFAEVARENDLPVFMTEMRSDGLQTAVLIHHAMTYGAATMYVQNDYMVSAGALSENPNALIRLTEESFVLQEPFFALWHYAAATQPGFVRVGVQVDSEDILATAWAAPDDEVWTVVLVNAGNETQKLELELGASEEDEALETEVTRTSFGTAELGASLGELSLARILEMPARSIVTVTVRR